MNYEIAKIQNRQVVKANSLIQKSRIPISSCSLQQQKALLYLISQLKPEQKEFTTQIFDIVEFCNVCGIDPQQGKNYRDLKAAIKGLRDLSFWVRGGEDEDEILMSWIQEVSISHKSGLIKIKFSDVLKPYLLELKEKFTQYELKYAMVMRSKYSLRLYEILKSYANINDVVNISLKRLKTLMSLDYEKWYDIKRKVIDVALNEINIYTDLNIEYIPIKKGRSFYSIDFYIYKKINFNEQINAARAVHNRLSKYET